MTGGLNGYNNLGVCATAVFYYRNVSILLVM
ncbi:MAG: hypothetical protein ACI85U_001896 [Candidatus Promineifilaceae bacterium]|jgi:hypothetical protein